MKFSWKVFKWILIAICACLQFLILIVIFAFLRNELHKLWDDCFYSPEQRNRFRFQADI